MSKPLVLIYGLLSANALMKRIAMDTRAKDKTVEVNLRSAAHFTPDQVEAAKAVLVIGEHPAIVEAYKGKADVSTIAEEEAEDALAQLDTAAKDSDGEGGEGKPDENGKGNDGAPAGGGEDKAKPNTLTKPELLAHLKALKVDFEAHGIKNPDKLNKGQLVDLLEKVTAEKQAQE